MYKNYIMVNVEVKQKISDFVTHLFNSPNISGENMLIAEDMIFGFISQNLDKFKTMFRSPNFFPQLEANSVLQLIISDIFERSYQEVLPKLKDHVASIDFSFLENFNNSIDINMNFVKDKIILFLDDAFKVKEVRFHLSSTYNIFEHDIIEKYLSQVFEHHGSVYHEIVRVQRNNLELNKYINYIKVIFILRVIIYIKFELPELYSGQSVNIKNFENIPANLKKYTEALSKKSLGVFPGMPEEIISMAIKSNYKRIYTDKQDATAKLVYILAQRYQNYKVTQKLDKGAESPDKSWFGIMKKNADFYGFDKRILDGLYIIAGDNNW